MDESTNASIEQLVRRFKEKGLSRNQFIAALSRLGASATGIAILLAVADTEAATAPTRPHTTQRGTTHHNTNLHEAHVRRQGTATRNEADGPPESLSPRQEQMLQTILDDYADHAVVEDPLFAEPIVGKTAIGKRKLAEMTSMAGVTIEVVHRFAHRDQVVAEWVVRGTHQGNFMGFAGTGRPIEIRGMTVVTREHGKIVKESLYYDVAEIYRQMG